MTKGEYRVETDFNVSGLTAVDGVKQITAGLIDEMEKIVLARGVNSEAARCASLAQTAYEQAAMWAVKAITKQPVPAEVA